MRTCTACGSFFYPPPRVSFSGCWVDDRDPAGQRLCVSMGVDDGSREFQAAQLEDNHRCLARSLYIGDSDKRKSFAICIQVSHANGHYVGMFKSKPIRVISKPSKKRQVTRNSECAPGARTAGVCRQCRRLMLPAARAVCIAMGTEVSLFNRLRSQASSTRFLSMEGGRFVSSSHLWGSFVLEPLETVRHAALRPTLAAARPCARCRGGRSASVRLTVAAPRTGPVCRSQPSSRSTAAHGDSTVRYGAAIRLRCAVSGVRSPPLFVRKVEHTTVHLDASEPVLQLHRIALQLQGTSHMYFAPTDDAADAVDAVPAVTMPAPMTHIIDDAAAWTVIGTGAGMHGPLFAHRPLMWPSRRRRSHPLSLLSEPCCRRGGRHAGSDRAPAQGSGSQTD